MTKADCEKRLLDLVKERAYREGDFVLSSGKRSPYYFDGKQITCHPEGSYLLSLWLLEIARECGADCIGGLTLGADPIAGAACPVSYREGYPLNAFIVRKAPKDHGTKSALEGILPANAQAIVVDDVCTTGASLFKAIEAVEGAGGQVVKVVVLVDRKEGGGDLLREKGYDFRPVFEIDALR
ncbi:MAG: orotate phosphoribosyltransferase [Armatimonadetes bacterium]|nr:orotate phosphoribosyltransferase [Armatimonadota bacterium]